jgi:hypothetical protein
MAEKSSPDATSTTYWKSKPSGGTYHIPCSISNTISSYRYGMSINNDSVVRSVFYKYMHPKEVFIAEGILVPDLIRKKVRLRWSFFTHAGVTLMWHSGYLRMLPLVLGGRRLPAKHPAEATIPKPTSWPSCIPTGRPSTCSAPPCPFSRRALYRTP